MDIRERIVLATLPHVAFDGWTGKALKAGARDAGLKENAVDLALPDGPVEAVECLAAIADKAMTEALARQDLKSLKIRERITLAVRTRLEQWTEEREAMRHAAALLALPQNLATGTRCTAHTVDAIWKAIGDRSADFSWYTKRATLAGVYLATVLYWLDDGSENCADTWEFLDRRIENVVGFSKIRKGVENCLANLPNPFDSLGARRA